MCFSGRSSLSYGPRMIAQTLLLLHIVSFSLLIAGSVLGSVVLAAMKRVKSVGEMVPLMGLLQKAPALTVPGSLLSMLTGSLLIWHQGLSFGAPWISGAYTLWIIAFATSLAVLKPAMKQLGGAVAAAASQGIAQSNDVDAALRSGRVRGSTAVLHFCLVGMLLVMVFKPA